MTSEVTELNMTSVVGDMVNLPCNSTHNSDVDWRHQDTPTSPVYYVYTNGLVYDIFKSRFTVDRRPQQGKYDLVISLVQLTDAGLYICIDDGGFSQRRFIYELSVIPGTVFISLTL